MDKAVKERWVAALRSGKYRQGREYLREDPEDRHHHAKFCCLGVLCKVEGVEHSEGASFLPARFARKVRVSKFNQETLAIVNDGDDYGLGIKVPKDYVVGKRWSFRKIADWIEENL